MPMLDSETKWLGTRTQVWVWEQSNYAVLSWDTIKSGVVTADEMYQGNTMNSSFTSYNFCSTIELSMVGNRYWGGQLHTWQLSQVLKRIEEGPNSMAELLWNNFFILSNHYVRYSISITFNRLIHIIKWPLTYRTDPQWYCHGSSMRGSNRLMH